MADRDTIIARLGHININFPDNDAFVFYTPTSRQSITYGRLYQLASRFARRLIDQDFKRYDVIANTLPNSPERLVTDLGIIFAGCIPMNGQIVLASGEDFFSSAKDAACRGVIVSPRDQQSAWQLLKGAVGTNCDGSGSELFARFSRPEVGDLTTAVLVNREESEGGCPLISSLDLDGGEGYVTDDVSPQDVAYIFTTSGSTGYSKLVDHTHLHVIHGFQRSSLEITEKNLRQGRQSFNNRPFGWSGGFPFNVFAAGVKMNTLDMFYEFKEPKEKPALIWKILKEINCPIPFLIPSEFYEVLGAVGDIAEEDRLNCLGTGSQPIRKKCVEDMFKLAKRVMVFYGLTETNLLAFNTVLEKGQFEDYCVGKPTKSLRVITPQREDCSPGDIGTIVVSDNNNFSGYFSKASSEKNRPEHIFFDNGWFNTEDNGYFDDKGRLYVIGRQKEVISYGVHQIYPGWLEKKMAAHSDVIDVVIVPVSDPVLVNEICACVKPVPGVVLSTEKLAQIAGGIFATDGEDCETPKPNYFCVLEDFPRKSTGKTDRNALRSMAEAKFGKC